MAPTEVAVNCLSVLQIVVFLASVRQSVAIAANRRRQIREIMRSIECSEVAPAQFDGGGTEVTP